METLWQDLRYGARMLARNPSVTLVAVLALGLGIGANTAIFSVVNGILFQPFSFPEAERLVWFWEVQPEDPTAPFSAADYLDYQKQNQTFEEVSAVRSLGFTMTGAGEAERLRGDVVTPDFFRMLGVRPMLGRDFDAADAASGAPRVALLQQGFWVRRFGGDKNVVGRVITLNEKPVTIIGVMPQAASYSRQVDFCINPGKVVPEVFPNYKEDLVQNRAMHYLGVMGRLKRGVTLVQAQADMNTIVARLQKENAANAGHSVKLISYYEYVTGDIKPTLLLLLGAVGVVLLIACANITNLLLARAAARQKEIAVRVAMGAARTRIVRQLLTESTMLALLGGALGIVLAYWGVDLLVAIIPRDTPRISQIHLSGTVLAFSAALSLLTGLLFGLAPAMETSRPGTSEVLKEGSRTMTGSRGRLRLRNLLVVSEVALALVVLAGAGLLLRSMERLLSVRPGFRPDHLLTMRVTFSSARYAGANAPVDLLQQLIPRLEALPGVEGVALSNDVPLEGQDTTNNVRIEGRPPLREGDATLAGLHVVNPRYFRAMGIPLLRGREFDEHDMGNSLPVAVINEAMAKRFWPNEDPLGKKFTLFLAQNGAAREVVGVVGNVKHNGLNAPDSMDGYAPIAQEPWGYFTIFIRTRTDSAAMVAAVRREVQALDPNLPVFGVRSMDQIVAESMGSRRSTLSLMGLFAVLALVLAAVGIYGVISYTVTQRTQEIGIRVALGAQRYDIFRMVVGHSLGLTLIGVAAGLAGSLALTRFLTAMLFGVTATDLVTLTGVSVLLGLVAYFASYFPARRAMHIDPMVALRHE